MTKFALATLLGTITIDQNMELNIVRYRINTLMKEKGLRRPSTDLSASIALMSPASSSLTTNDSGTGGAVSSSRSILLMDPGNNFQQFSNSTSSVTASSLSNKFVSNDWCFVDCKILFSNSKIIKKLNLLILFYFSRDC